MSTELQPIEIIEFLRKCKQQKFKFGLPDHMQVIDNMVHDLRNMKVAADQRAGSGKDAESYYDRIGFFIGVVELLSIDRQVLRDIQKFLQSFNRDFVSEGQLLPEAEAATLKDFWDLHGKTLTRLSEYMTTEIE